MIPAKESGFPRNIILASLPLLFQITDFSSACFLGALACPAIWATGLFFGAAYSLFPKPLFKTAVLLWLAALAQMAWYFWGVKPFWIVSLAFLTLPMPFEKPKSIPFRFLLLQGAGFWAVLVYVGIFRDFLGKQYSLIFFQQAAGAFFLLSLLAVIWRPQKTERNA